MGIVITLYAADGRFFSLKNEAIHHCRTTGIPSDSYVTYKFTCSEDLADFLNSVIEPPDLESPTDLLDPCAAVDLKDTPIGIYGLSRRSRYQS